MICPGCKGEYVDGIEECPTCGVALVEDAAGGGADAAQDGPVVVFSSTSASLVAIAKSILIDAGIEFGVAGEQVQDLFGYGRFPVGASVIAGPITVCVRTEDAPDARELLSNVSSDPSASSLDTRPSGGDSELSGFWRASRIGARAYAWAFVVFALLVSGVVWLLDRVGWVIPLLHR